VRDWSPARQPAWRPALHRFGDRRYAELEGGAKSDRHTGNVLLYITKIDGLRRSQSE
jgi:hypothetical protein